MLAYGQIEPVYQPIVRLDGQAVVAYEALARGPRGSLLEMPGALFGAAARHGRLTELDWACRAAAISGAFGAEYLPPASLFVNVEPVAAGQTVPTQYEDLMARAQDGLRVVFEFTERALTDFPGDVLYAVRLLRKLGAVIALDDVGVDPRSLALLPFLEPEVVKLDMSLVHAPRSAAALETVYAVMAHVEQTGAIVVAEGVETPEHLASARALGATLGQGWLFGKPGPLPAPDSWAPVELFDKGARAVVDVSQLPWDWLEQCGAAGGRVGTDGLQAMWQHVLLKASAHGTSTVVLAAPGPIASAGTRAPLSALASSIAFVGELEPRAAPALPRVRSGPVAPGEPLAEEACLCLLAPHFAVTLAARRVPTEPTLLDYRISHDRAVTATIARRLMARIDPQGSSPAA